LEHNLAVTTGEINDNTLNRLAEIKQDLYTTLPNAINIRNARVNARLAEQNKLIEAQKGQISELRAMLFEQVDRVDQLEKKQPRVPRVSRVLFPYKSKFPSLAKAREHLRKHTHEDSSSADDDESDLDVKFGWNGLAKEKTGAPSSSSPILLPDSPPTGQPSSSSSSSSVVRPVYSDNSPVYDPEAVPKAKEKTTKTNHLCHQCGYDLERGYHSQLSCSTCEWDFHIECVRQPNAYQWECPQCLHVQTRADGDRQKKSQSSSSSCSSSKRQPRRRRDGDDDNGKDDESERRQRPRLVDRSTSASQPTVIDEFLDEFL